MMHSKSLKTMLAVATVVSVAFAAPNKLEISNEIVPIGKPISKNGEAVSASWGGFKASALLAEDGSAAASVGGNGLGAGAGYGTGGVGAGAGVFGNGASTGSASAGSASAGYPAGGYGNGGGGFGSASAGAGHNGGGFFDRIFAIPINVLQSVNTYLNQKQQGQSGAAYVHPVKPGSSADKVPEVSVGADYGQGGAASVSGAYAETGTKVGHGKAGDSMMVHKNTNYNDIFNIPITALRSVQNLLNG